MKRKNWFWILLFLLLVAGGLLLYRQLGQTGGTVAVITVDGEEIERVDLSRIKDSYDIVIETGYGRNTVHVEPGAISVTEADCPDRICVHQGRLTGGGIPIICMPHRLVIEIEDSELDG